MDLEKMMYSVKSVRWVHIRGRQAEGQARLAFYRIQNTDCMFFWKYLSVSWNVL